MDRNADLVNLPGKMSRSLSARRAWIEISIQFVPITTSDVALRKESVDRNMAFCVDYLKSTWSLSARRAWIEIAMSNGK